MFVPFSPVVGTPMLSMQPLDAIERGELQDKPLIIGSVRDEGVIFVYEAFGKVLASRSLAFRTALGASPSK